MRTWTIAERINAMEAQGLISPPFTDTERALARAASEAFYFTSELKEPPARCEQNATGVCWYLDWGIGQVLYSREDGTLATSERDR